MKRFAAQIEKAFGTERRGQTLLVIGLLALSVIEVHALARDLREAYLADRDETVEVGRFNDETHALPEEIQSWMTFDYINAIFGLPGDYLKTALAISDNRYPRMRIGRAAREARIDHEEYLELLRNAVASHLQP